MRTKIFPRPALAKLLKSRGNRKKVVFTNGCFDLLHLGHLKLLRKAKSLGDVLVVAINSDRSVRKLKGSNRPLVNERARAEILAELSCVDYVTIFPEDTPARTIELFRPDVLVKGGDYQISEIVGRDAVKKVVRFPLVKNFSTTALIRKIVRAYGA